MLLITKAHKLSSDNQTFLTGQKPDLFTQSPSASSFSTERAQAKKFLHAYARTLWFLRISPQTFPRGAAVPEQEPGVLALIWEARAGLALSLTHPFLRAFPVRFTALVIDQSCSVC